jgi:tetratricopeptide (TPR) repeat protein
MQPLKQLWRAFLLLLILPAPGAAALAQAQDVPQAARDVYERALKLAAAGRPTLAVTMLREAIRISPDYYDAHLALGGELALSGRFDEAIRELDRARALDPRDPRAYQTFGMVLMRQQKYPLAAAVFGEATRLAPSNPVHPLSRAVALIHHARTLKPRQSERDAADRKYFLDLAAQMLEKAKELGGGELRPDHFSMAMFYEMRGEPARAAEELEQYLQETPHAKNEAAVREAVRKLRGGEPAKGDAAPPKDR